MFYILCLGIIESPMRLDAHSVDSDSFGLEFLDHSHDSVDMCRPPYVEVIVVQLCIRSIAVRKNECVPYDLISVAVESLDPSFVAVFTEFADNLVDDVPGIDPAGISACHCLDVLTHGFDEFFAGLRRTVLVLPIERRSLVVPYEGMAEYPHVVILAELNIFIRFPEVPYVRSRMYCLRFEAVLWRECVEMFEYQLVRLFQAAAGMERIDCAAYHEAVCICILERCFFRYGST